MIVEHALLRVRPGESVAFETAMQAALPLIAASPGFLGIEVRPSVDMPDYYLLLVKWQAVADHREGFRTSKRYEAWRDLLHRYYDPMPEVSYFGDPI